MIEPTGKSKGLCAFFVLAYALVLASWGIMAAFQVAGSSANPDLPIPSPGALLLFAVGGFSPSVAGIIMTRRVEGRPGLKELWRRATRFDLGWKWYAVISFIPISAAVLSVAAYLLRGGAFVESPLLARPLSLIKFSVLIFLAGPISEEFGWRGFALDRLLTRWNAASASLILGALWALWHLPLFFIPGTVQQQYGDHIPEFIIFALGVIGKSVVYTWMYLGTRRSLWSAILHHAVSNYTVSFLATLTIGSLGERLVIESVYILIAAFIVVSWKRSDPRLAHAV